MEIDVVRLHYQRLMIPARLKPDSPNMQTACIWSSAATLRAALVMQ